MTAEIRADLVHDLNYHVTKGKCWLVWLNLDFSCPEVGDDGINVDTYIIANDPHHAKYIATTLYPEATGVCVSEEPVTTAEYVARRG